MSLCVQKNEKFLKVKGEEMKTLFVALNAKYIHTNLALRSIATYCREFSPVIREYTINDSMDNIIASIHSEKADIVAFSCYIWNIEEILYIAESLKKVNPELKIILGGHEVSYDSSEILQNNPSVDFIIRGEGEKPMQKLLSSIIGENTYEDVLSLTYRDGDSIKENPLSEPGHLNEYEFCYDESIRSYKSKIIYYESSRGCPFRCSYCLSGRSGGVDYLDIDRVKKELLFFIENEVPLVKFVDRTFNADKKRAREIFRLIIENSKKTRFHFELAGNLIDDETIEVLKSAPEGIIQFEIGVQSTNPDTLREIGRNIPLSAIEDKIEALLEIGTIHIHLDLIAGLPYENYESFRKSFDDVVRLRPHVLQLGFLKLLKGSKLRDEEEKFSYKYKAKAPYEVMENNFITFDELIKLKYIEDLFEKYYNSGDFKRCMDYLFKNYPSPFGVFEKIYDYYMENRLFDRAVSLEERYDIIGKIFNIEDYAKADRLTNPKAKIPYEVDEVFKAQCFEFLKNENNLEKYLPEYKNSAPRNIYKRLRFQKIFGGVYVYDGTELIDITDEF